MNMSEGTLPESLLLAVPRTRWLLMADDCGAATADQLVARLHELSLASPEAIVIEITCSRADLWGALRLYDMIRFLGTPVLGFLSASACTEAIIVLQGCETRIATSASELMLRSLVTASLELPLMMSTTKETALAAMEAHRSSSEQLRRKHEDLLSARSGRPPDQIRHMTGGSTIFVSAQAALAEGLIDLLVCGAEPNPSRS